MAYERRAGEANMHEISIKFPHILPFSVSQQHCYFPPRLALRRPSAVRTYSLLLGPAPCPSFRRSSKRFKWTLFYRRV